MSDDDKYLRVKNLNLAVFLYSNDQQIAGVNQLNRKQSEFCFIRTNLLDELEWLYKFGDKDDDRLLVSVHKYERARKELLDRLND